MAQDDIVCLKMLVYIKEKKMTNISVAAPTNLETYEDLFEEVNILCIPRSWNVVAQNSTNN